MAEKDASIIVLKKKAELFEKQYANIGGEFKKFLLFNKIQSGLSSKEATELKDLIEIKAKITTYNECIELLHK